MKKILTNIFIAIAVSCLMSCDTFWQGMAQGVGGYGGYGMGGYQVMPGGFVRNTSMDYLLDPNYAIQQVNQQNRQEYLQQTNGGKTMTYEEWYAKIKTPAVLGTSGSSSSSSSSRSSSSSSSRSSSSSSSSGSMCRLCAGTGTCKTCSGRGYYYNPLDLSKTVLCPNCQSNHNGKCSSCGGTGKK